MSQHEVSQGLTAATHYLKVVLPRHQSSLVAWLVIWFRGFEVALKMPKEARTVNTSVDAEGRGRTVH